MLPDLPDQGFTAGQGCDVGRPEQVTLADPRIVGGKTVRGMFKRGLHLVEVVRVGAGHRPFEPARGRLRPPDGRAGRIARKDRVRELVGDGRAKEGVISEQPAVEHDEDTVAGRRGGGVPVDASAEIGEIDIEGGSVPGSHEPESGGDRVARGGQRLDDLLNVVRQRVAVDIGGEHGIGARAVERVMDREGPVRRRCDRFAREGGWREDGSEVGCEDRRS